MRAAIIGLLSLLPVFAVAGERTLIHDGETRRYLIDEPAATGPAPAIVVLHGGGGRPEQIRRAARFTLHREGWVMLYPAGLGKMWNDGRTALAGGPLRTGDDLGFLSAMLDGLVAEGRIDPARIYFTGISNGGAMTQRMLCQAPRLAAGGVSVAMNYPVGLDCPEGVAKPMLYVLGTEDPLVPYLGGPITLGRKDRGAVRPADESLGFFARRAGCDAAVREVLPDRAPFDRTRAVWTRLRGCAVPVGMITLEGGGHTWPGERDRPLLRAIVGRTSREIDATAEIERFFRRLAGE